MEGKQKLADFLRCLGLERYLSSFEQNELHVIDDLKNLSDANFYELGLQKRGEVLLIRNSLDNSSARAAHPEIILDYLQKVGKEDLAAVLKEACLLDCRVWDSIDDDILHEAGIDSIGARMELIKSKPEIQHAYSAVLALDAKLLELENLLGSESISGIVASKAQGILDSFPSDYEAEKLVRFKATLIEFYYNSNKKALTLGSMPNIKRAKEFFAQNLDYKDCRQLYLECVEAIYQSAIVEMANSDSKEAMLNTNSLKAAIKIFESIKDYKDSEKKIDECKARIEEKQKEAKYVFASNYLRSKHKNDLLFAISRFKELGDYKDSKDLIDKCRRQLKAKRIKGHILFIVGFLVLAAVVFIFAGPCIHSFNANVVTEATCTSDSICRICHRVVGKATGHTFTTSTIKNPTCTETGTQRAVCTICGYEKNEVIEAKGHTFVEVDRTSATCRLPGTVTSSCSECGEIKSESYKLNHDYFNYVCKLCGLAEDPARPKAPYGEYSVEYLMVEQAKYENGKVNVIFRFLDSKNNDVISACRVKYTVYDSDDKFICKGYKYLKSSDSGSFKDNWYGTVFNAMKFTIDNSEITEKVKRGKVTLEIDFRDGSFNPKDETII